MLQKYQSRAKRLVSDTYVDVVEAKGNDVAEEILHEADKENIDTIVDAWFIESGPIAASIIVLVIRRKPLFKSKPGKHLLLATILIIGLVAILLSTPLAGLFGFTSLSILYFYAIGIILLIYVVTTEIVKKIFYKRIEF